MKNNEVMVSVCMITYNHEKFIGDAIEGVLMQQTDFPVELIIGEDCSTDNTRKIVLQYTEKYPDIIRLLLPESNLGMMKNFIKTMEAAKGKYIALCEGDDYWTDPYKLQKQVDFLEANRDYIACFHNAFIQSGESIIKLFNELNQKKYPTAVDLIEKRWFIATASLVFRNEIEIPNWFTGIVNGDYALELILATRGNFYYIPDVMSVYRLHNQSVSHDLNNRKILLYNHLINLYELIKPYYNNEIQKSITTKITMIKNDITVEKRNEKLPFIKYFNWRFYKRIIFGYFKIIRY